MTTLFAIGSNGSGQLGIGHKEDVSVPKPAFFSTGDLSTSEVSATCPAPVRNIAAGGNHTLMLTTAGSLFWSGDSTSGACGRVADAKAAALPHFSEVDLGSVLGEEEKTGRKSAEVVLVAATWTASVIVAKNPADGRATRVFSFGLGSKGELGLGPLLVRAPGPDQVRVAANGTTEFPPAGTEVVDLAAGLGHVVAVLSNGEAWGWGAGRKGQLGEEDAEKEGMVHAPRKITGLGFAVKRAVCGREFTCLVGDPEGGEIVVLGSDKWSVKSNAPDKVAGWKDIGASWGNVYVLMTDGRLLSWGRDDHGQITLANKDSTTKIAIGSEHALALTGGGDVVAWGWGEHGNCGPGQSREGTKGIKNIIASSKYIPPGSKIAAIGAGCATSWIGINIPP